MVHYKDNTFNTIYMSQSFQQCCERLTLPPHHTSHKRQSIVCEKCVRGTAITKQLIKTAITLQNNM